MKTDDRVPWLPLVTTPAAGISLVGRAAHELDLGHDKTIHFQSLAGLLYTIDHRNKDEDFFKFDRVDATSFEQIEAAFDEKQLKARLHFRPALNLLLLTVPSWPHEVASQSLQKCLISTLVRMGVEDSSYQLTGSTTFPIRRGNGDGGRGEGDGTFTPHTRINGDKWPTLVIEVGLSESLADLRQDMRWWFEVSKHQIKLVLLAKLYPQTREILIERYIKDMPPPRPGATSTRNMPGPQPHLVQSISITPQQGQVPEPGQHVSQFTVDGGPLVLEFELLFLRPANPDAGEADIVLTTAQLEEMATSVWA